jgi:hypothetical protein
MKHTRLFFSLLVSLLFLPLVSASVQPVDTIPVTIKVAKLTQPYIGPDGPYILYFPQGVKAVSVDEAGYIVEKNYVQLPENYTFTVTSHDKKSHFDVTLHPVVRPDWKRQSPDSLLIISDIHGKWDPHTEHNEGDGPVAYSEYDYRVVNVDVQTQDAMDNGIGRGILILKNGKTFYRI